MVNNVIKKGQRLFLFILFLSGYLSLFAHDTVYIVQEAWHTGVVLKVKDIKQSVWPGIKQYQSYQYIDVGWGDEFFYQASENLVWLAARAVLFPTSAVIRLHAFSAGVKAYYHEGKVMRMTVDESRFDSLCFFISNSLKSDKQGNMIPSNVYGRSVSFFRAKRKYHLFRTCNTWVALAFKRSGFNVSSFLVLSSYRLFKKLEKLKNTKYLILR